MAFHYPEHVYKLTFAFNGTNFEGWQRQTDGGRTVQQTMEDILRTLFRRDDVNLVGSGRTDAGVHALAMTASFRLDAKLVPGELAAALMKRFPHDIRLLSAEEEVREFNAHTSAIGKSYVYAVNTGYENLFLRDACWSWPDAPHLKDLPQALAALPGTRDFVNFTGRKKDRATTVRTIFRAETIAFGPILCFYFSGDGFLHKMVRRIMGFLHSVALGELSPDDFVKSVYEPGFAPCEAVAPARGLYMKKVFYSVSDRENDRLEFPPFVF